MISTEVDKRSGAPVPLLARQDEDGLHWRSVLRFENW
jgi:hypothetical protein